jgi:hypothetical protein
MEDDFLNNYKSILNECPICYEPIMPIDKATLQCGHQLHKRCLAKWAGNPKKESDRNKTCPVCRGPLELKREVGMIRRETEIGGKRRRTRKRITRKRKTRIRKRNKY